MMTKLAAPSTPTLRIAGAQIENVVGDVEGNAERIAAAMEWAEEQEADVLLLPELALTGYPVEDLAVRADFVAATSEALAELAARSERTTTVVGTIDRVPPRRSGDTQRREVAIGAALLCDGEVRGIYHKVLLPNYAVFDEARNFAPGTAPEATWLIGETVVGVVICEDSWSEDGPPESQAAAGAQVLMIQNASPFERRKADSRLEHCRRLWRRTGLPVVYVNGVGGQDELVFDGGSMVLGTDGELLHRSPQFAPDRFCVELEPAPRRSAALRPRSIHVRPSRGSGAPPIREPAAEPMAELEQIWQALALGVRDFAHRNDVTTAVVAISGGIDAAVTAALAVDALGAANVRGVSMPGPHTADFERDDAERLARALGIELELIPVEPITDRIGIDEPNGDEELGQRNLESRVRAAVVQASADSTGSLALASVNKTELSLGSFAPHDALAGAYAPLKDCPKTLVYELAAHRNRHRPVIPERTIERTPTALLIGELALSGFAEVDRILVRRLEAGEGLEELVAAGFERELVRAVLQLVDETELSRRQSPPGVKITRRAYGTDRRMPISNRWRPFQTEKERVAPKVAAGVVPGSTEHAREGATAPEAAS